MMCFTFYILVLSIKLKWFRKHHCNSRTDLISSSSRFQLKSASDFIKVVVDNACVIREDNTKQTTVSVYCFANAMYFTSI